MRQKSLDVLEFDKIKAMVEQEAVSDLGQVKAREMSPQVDRSTVIFQMDETDEIAQIYNKLRLSLIHI